MDNQKAVSDNTIESEAIDNNNILVSVIVATYHRVTSLLSALESIADQTYQNVEVIVVDDNADEAWNAKVADIIAVFKQKYPRIAITYICNKTNEGSAKTRNIGIQAARGNYITFLDDDDIYLPQKIEKQLIDMLDSAADYGITDLEIYNTNGKLIDHRIRSYITTNNKEALLRNHLMYHLTGTDTLMFKKDYLLEIGMFPLIDLGDEFFLMEKAILSGGKLCYSPHCYVKAYIHEGEEEGLSSGEQKIMGENSLYEMKKKYFSKMDKKDVRFIKVRHHMVITFAQLRRKHYLSMAKNGIEAILISPSDTLKILKQRN